MTTTPKKTPVALQLWSIKDEVKRDFAATVAAVAEMGYSGVELAGYGNLDVKGAKAALDAAGLKLAGMHVGLDALKTNLTNVIGEALEDCAPRRVAQRSEDCVDIQRRQDDEAVRP